MSVALIKYNITVQKIAFKRLAIGEIVFKPVTVTGSGTV